MKRLAWQTAVLATIVLGIYVGVLIVDSVGPRPFIFVRRDGPVQLLTGDVPARDGLGICFYEGGGELLLDEVFGTAMVESSSGPPRTRKPVAWPPGVTTLRTGDVVQVFNGGELVAETGKSFRSRLITVGPGAPGWVGPPLPASGVHWMCFAAAAPGSF